MPRALKDPRKEFAKQAHPGLSLGVTEAEEETVKIYLRKLRAVSNVLGCSSFAVSEHVQK